MLFRSNLLTRLAVPRSPASNSISSVSADEDTSAGPSEMDLIALNAEVLEPDTIREVILATSPTTEGEATAAYLAQEIHRVAPGLRVTRIATGVPAGSDIEYADEVTMTRAMEGRRDF